MSEQWGPALVSPSRPRDCPVPWLPVSSSAPLTSERVPFVVHASQSQAFQRGLCANPSALVEVQVWGEA